VACETDVPQVDDSVFLGVRAEEVMLVKPDQPIRAGRDFNIIEGAVSEVVEKSATHTIVLNGTTNSSLVLELPNFLYRRYEFAPGRPVRVRIRPDKFCVIRKAGV
jgi:hypothetical protein